MIPPRQQWCIQIDITNACGRKCSNCTRMLAHVRKPFFMSTNQFREAAQALADFPIDSEPHPKRPNGGTKVVGIIGGEPLLHPKFSDFTNVLVDMIPEKRHCGLWTSLPWRQHKHASQIKKSFGYLNHNLHNATVQHQPVLVAIKDVILDKDQMWELIDDCWVQQKWSSTITPKGFFFCEVAGAMDMVFGGPGGLPVTPDCWRHDLDAYREQIERWCPRCSAALPLPARQDSEEIDDISDSNLAALRKRNSPRVQRQQYQLYDVSQYQEQANWRPHQYKQ